MFLTKFTVILFGVNKNILFEVRLVGEFLTFGRNYLVCNRAPHVVVLGSNESYITRAFINKQNLAREVKWQAWNIKTLKKCLYHQVQSCVRV